MASEQARQLRQQGIAAAKAGQKDEARKLLQQSIRLEPSNEAAWLWLASIASDQRERLFCLHKLLEINPNNEPGLQALRGLGLTREQLAEQLGQMQASAPTSDAPGVPLPDAQRLAEAQTKADMIVREYLAPLRSSVNYVHKTRQRAGERDVVYLRIYVAVGAVVGLLVLGIVLYTGAVNTPEIASVLFAPTPTITNTPAPPTLTPTNTPGVTPTSSPTPRLTLTPSPTVPPEVRAAPPDLPPTPTDIYPSISERTLRGAVVLLDQGRYDIAQPTLEAERGLTGARFDPIPYYYDAVAWLQAGDTDRALRVLQDAETRILDEQLLDDVKPLIDTGFALVNLQLAQEANENGDGGQVEAYLSVVEQRAEAAITTDPLLAQPYLLLARRHSLVGDVDEALGVLDRGLAVGQLASNINFIVEKGNIYLQQGLVDEAAYQAFLALYIDPLAEPAHLLRIRTALAQVDPGLAVIYAQEYLFYYPGSVVGYTLLGDTRVVEGNTDLALIAYNQALAGEDDNPARLDALVERGRVYQQQRRYDLAQGDFTEALDLSEGDLNIQALRIQAAYEAGDFVIARDDADELFGEGIVSDGALQLLQARILVDEASDSEDYREALGLLDTLEGLPDEQRAIASEYQAQAHFSLGNNGDALNAIDRALAGGDTGSRHYLRGKILEAQGEQEAALREYEWVLTWGTVYPYSFLPDAEARVEALRNE